MESKRVGLIRIGIDVFILIFCILIFSLVAIGEINVTPNMLFGLLALMVIYILESIINDLSKLR